MDDIKGNVQPRFPISFPYRFTDKPMLRPFEGEVREDGFTISRVINYRNSFLPVIEGKVVAKGDGSELHVELRPARAVRLFLSIWLGFLGVFATLSFIPLSRGEMDGLLLLVLPIFMGSFGIVISHAGFSHEHGRALKELSKILGKPASSTR